MKGLKVLLAIVAIILIFTSLYFAYQFYLSQKSEVFYLAADQALVEVLNEDMVQEELARGSMVEVYQKEETIDGNNYRLAKYQDRTIYLSAGSFIKDKADVVLEDIIYLKKDAILYEDASTSAILASLDKGKELSVIGYDGLRADGTLRRYEVKVNDLRGYVRSEYTTLDHEEAQKVYRDEKVRVHLEREDLYGGGSPSALDFTPSDKPRFADNPLLEDARTLYLNARVLPMIDDYIALAKESGINAFVIDIRDTDVVSFISKAAEEYSPSANKAALYTAEEFKGFVLKAQEAGIYTIGRITVFRDPYLAQDHPELAITNTQDDSLFYYNSTYWPSAYKREVWQYNVALALEAADLCDLNEIQFDYMRFPDLITRFEKEGLIDLKNEYDESKVLALTRFLNYAKDELHDQEVYLSVDVFGESANDYVTAYGQYWPIISNTVDVISAMPYPDHFNPHDYGIEEVVWQVPYKLLSIWSTYAKARQAECPSPAIVRTWIQGYDSIKEPYVVYDSTKIAEQIQALKDGGLNGGYIIWNSSSNLLKYESYASAFDDQ